MTEIQAKYTKEQLIELVQTDPEFIAQLEEDYGVVVTITGELREVKTRKVRNAIKEGAEAGKQTGTKTVVKAAMGASKTKEVLSYNLYHAPKEKVREVKAERPAKKQEREAKRAAKKAEREAKHREALQKAELREARREAEKAAMLAAEAEQAEAAAKEAEANAEA